MLDDVGQATVVADEFEHARSQQGDDDELAHAGHALAHGTHPVDSGAAAFNSGHNAGGNDAEDEHFHDVHAAEGGDEHEQVGQHFEPLGFLRDFHRGEVPAQGHIEHQHEHGCGADDGEVCLEFILHGAALGAGGGNGGIRNEREVVPEECAAYDAAGHEGQVGARFICQPHGHGHEGNDGTHRGADGKGNDTGCQEHACQHHVCREQRKGEVHRGIH